MSCIICNHEIKEYEPENFIAIQDVDGTIKEYLVCSSCIEYDDVQEWLADILKGNNYDGKITLSEVRR